MNPVHGLAASYSSPERFGEAIRRAREAGYTRLDTYMPFAIEEGIDRKASRRSPVPAAMAIGGVLGGAAAYWMQYYATHDYPLNTGGRPLTSWPAFVPITFELGVLTAALAGLATFLVMAGLPRLDHPLFSLPGFVGASRDRFFLCVRSDDLLFAGEETARLLRETGAESVEEVPS